MPLLDIKVAALQETVRENQITVTVTNSALCFETAALML